MHATTMTSISSFSSEIILTAITTVDWWGTSFDDDDEK